MTEANHVFSVPIFAILIKQGETEWTEVLISLSGTQKGSAYLVE